MVNADDFLGALSQAMAGRAELDPRFGQEIRQAVQPLGSLCGKIAEERRAFESLQYRIRMSFHGFEEVRDLCLRLEDESLRFLVDVYGHSAQTIINSCGFLLSLEAKYDSLVKGKLGDDANEGKLGDDANERKLGNDAKRGNNEGNPQSARESSALKKFRKETATLPLPPAGPSAGDAALPLTYDYQRALKTAPELYGWALQGFVESVEQLQKIGKGIHKSLEDFLKYLEQRFVKSDSSKQQNQRELFLQMMSQEPKRAEYIKVRLVDDNPLLTDILLSFMENLPQYRNVYDKKHGTKIRRRELSPHGLERAVDNLVVISQYPLMEYLQNPQKFFQAMGGLLEEFYASLEKLREPYYQMLSSRYTQVFHDYSELHQRINNADKPSTPRLLKKIRNFDTQGIVQREDDVQPDNRREQDHFRLREELFDTLYKAMGKIADANSYEEKEKIAREAVLKAIELKSGIEEIITPHGQRKLRRDRALDNEYYEGAQGQIGQFYFERKPAPSVKLEEVIGESFGTAKRHMQEILEMAEFPHLMRLTAPGGKVRGNMLLIGPYGCGKTLLCQGIAGDPRVIGASASVSYTLTAYMHESVNNVRRIYDAGKKLFIDGREQKVVALILDEFDAWFAHNTQGNLADKDMQQIERTLAEILDGMHDYHGIITVATTNNPLGIPPVIRRRFKYVDIVGQLTTEERAAMLKMYLEKTFPLWDKLQDKLRGDRPVGEQRAGHGNGQGNGQGYEQGEVPVIGPCGASGNGQAGVGASIPEHYLQWAEKLKDAPGDVVRKVVDNIHTQFIPSYIKAHPREARRIETVLQKRLLRQGAHDEQDILYLKQKIARHRSVTPEDVEDALKAVLSNANVKMQIAAARKMYRDAELLKEEMSSGRVGFGLERRTDLYNR